MRGGPVIIFAIAGIDHALWEIKGKQFGAPVYELLGGPVRDCVRIYQWVCGDRLADVGEVAAKKVYAGITALKMNATPEIRRVDNPGSVAEAVERLRTVRDTVGPEVDIGVDLHGRVTKPMAKRLAKALEPHEPFFIEEPVLPEHNDALLQIANQTSTPIATAERIYSRWDFKRSSKTVLWTLFNQISPRWWHH
jgi:galactonate dehydratase